MAPETVQQLLNKELLTVKEVMILLGVTRKTIIKHTRDGWLDGFQVGYGAKAPWRIHSSSVRERMYSHSETD